MDLHLVWLMFWLIVLPAPWHLVDESSICIHCSQTLLARYLHSFQVWNEQFFLREISILLEDEYNKDLLNIPLIRPSKGLFRKHHMLSPLFANKDNGSHRLEQTYYKACRLVWLVIKWKSSTGRASCGFKDRVTAAIKGLHTLCIRHTYGIMLRLFDTNPQIHPTGIISLTYE